MKLLPEFSACNLGLDPRVQSGSAPKASFPPGCCGGAGGAPALGRLRGNRLEGNGLDKGLCLALVAQALHTWV